MEVCLIALGYRLLTVALLDLSIVAILLNAQALVIAVR